MTARGQNTTPLVERCRQIPIEPILLHLGAPSVPQGRREWLRMLCPFHAEDDPSASVSHVHRRFRCHGCGVHGDAVALLMEEEDIDFRAAVERAEGIAGIDGTIDIRRTRRRERLGTI